MGRSRTLAALAVLEAASKILLEEAPAVLEAASRVLLEKAPAVLEAASLALPCVSGGVCRAPFLLARRA